MNQKNKGGRPPLKIKRYHQQIYLTLHEGRDDDLIEWFKSIAKGRVAKQVKIALRQGGIMRPKKEAKEIKDYEALMPDDLLAGFLDAF